VPSILAGWAHRFDCTLAEEGEAAATAGSSGGYLATCLAGYGAGCVLLELGPPELTRAALLWLIPSSLVVTLGRLALRGDVQLAMRAAEDE
jgi:hypothetical protein